MQTLCKLFTDLWKRSKIGDILQAILEGIGRVYRAITIDLGIREEFRAYSLK
jgi:hypothetical protein